MLVRCSQQILKYTAREKTVVRSLNSFFFSRYADGKSLSTTSENVPLQKWVEPGEEMLQIIAVIEK